LFSPFASFDGCSPRSLSLNQCPKSLATPATQAASALIKKVHFECSTDPNWIQISEAVLTRASLEYSQRSSQNLLLNMAKTPRTKKDIREVIGLGAVFVLLGGLLGFLNEERIGIGLGALIGAVLFALIMTVGALLGMIGRGN